MMYKNERIPRQRKKQQKRKSERMIEGRGGGEHFGRNVIYCFYCFKMF